MSTIDQIDKIKPLSEEWKAKGAGDVCFNGYKLQVAERNVNPEGLLDFAFLFDQEIDPSIEDYCMEVSEIVTSFKSVNPDALISYHWHMNHENRTSVRFQIGSNQFLYMSAFPDSDMRASVCKARRSLRAKTEGLVICKTPDDAATAIINEVKRVCKLTSSKELSTR